MSRFVIIRDNANMIKLTVRASHVLWRPVTTGEENFGGRTPVGHVDIQPGKGDGVLDDGRNHRRWR